MYSLKLYMDYGVVEVFLSEKAPPVTELINRIKEEKINHKGETRFFDFVMGDETILTVDVNKLNCIQKVLTPIVNKEDEEVKRLNLELLKLQVEHYKNLNRKEPWNEDVD